MRTLLTLAAALGAALTLTAPAPAADLSGVALEEWARVADRPLKLFGAGIGTRAMLFDVYVLALYLPHERQAAAAFMWADDAPRRIVVTMLRDVGGDEFTSGVTSAFDDGEEAGPQRVRFAGHLARLGDALSGQGRGLRRGDTVTIDWVPGTGTVIALNGRPVGTPIRDNGFYTALLKVWLGERPADSALKRRLLRQLDETRAALAG